MASSICIWLSNGCSRASSAEQSACRPSKTGSKSIPSDWDICREVSFHELDLQESHHPPCTSELDPNQQLIALFSFHSGRGCSTFCCRVWSNPKLEIEFAAFGHKDSRKEESDAGVPSFWHQRTHAARETDKVSAQKWFEVCRTLFLLLLLRGRRGMEMRGSWTRKVALLSCVSLCFVFFFAFAILLETSSWKACLGEQNPLLRFHAHLADTSFSVHLHPVLRKTVLDLWMVVWHFYLFISQLQRLEARQWNPLCRCSLSLSLFFVMQIFSCN